MTTTNDVTTRSPGRLLWVDLETTGLNALMPGGVGGPWHVRDRLLEIACIVTDDSLVELARFQSVTNEARLANFPGIPQVVLEMHAKSGLWAESLTSDRNLSTVELDVLQLLRNYFPIDEGRSDPSRILLCGSTVSFDRTFLEVWMPKVARCLSHRHYDVSSINSMVQRALPAVWEGRPRDGTSGADSGAKHRAMDDIEASLRVARYYASRLRDGGPA